ncbi:MAG: type II toxin-antitoxin system PemK/MazF family toxin [Anaerolineaceae bacterium]
MTIFNQGDIVLVPYPFSDNLGVKKRPAVVISANWYNVNNSDCILAAITSSIQMPLNRDSIHIKASEIAQTGLIQESIIRTSKIFTIENHIIIKPIGKLNSSLRKKVHEKLLDMFNSS